MSAICQTETKKPSRRIAEAGRTLRWGALLLALMFSFAKLQAQQIQATLSADSTSVGRPVQLTVKVTGARGAQLPQKLNIDGLDTLLVQTSEQNEINVTGGSINRSFSSIYVYRVIPMKAGDFTIPALSMKIDGQQTQTNPLSLKVVGAGASVPTQPGSSSVPQATQGQALNQAQATPPGKLSDDKMTSGELLVPQTSAYVGEVIPIEVRFYFDGRFPAVKPIRINFSGEGFTATELTKITHKEVQIGGRGFNMLNLQGTITPVKTGTMEIPAASLQTAVVVPSGGSGPNDLLGTLFGQTEEKVIDVPTNTAKLEVKPLPEEGKPEDFSGAVGQFSIQATATPKKAAAGDPITLKVTVSGRGNFDAMTAPTLLDAGSWKTYPPNEKFEASSSDPVGYNGKKQFEYTIMAREDQTKTPVAEFSYFDPSIKKYVTLKSGAIPIDAKGGGVPATTPEPVATATPTPTPSAAPTTPASTPSPEDSLATQYAGGSFQPLLFNRAFLIANGVMGVIWLGVLLVWLCRAISSSAYARESAAHRERRRLLDQMNSTDLETSKFLTMGTEFVRARLEAEEPVSNLHDALEHAPISAETKTAVASMLDKADELNYAAGSVEGKLGPEERRKIVASLKEFDNELQKAR
ncbi:hypothetical protein BH09VER1_BH09VER1_07050 [soil metagenome]